MISKCKKCGKEFEPQKGLKDYSKHIKNMDINAN